jgi:hypothetical protein
MIWRFPGRGRLRLQRVRLGVDWRAQTDPAVRALVQRSAVPDARVRAGARQIIEAVRTGGAAAVRDANATYGGGLADGRLLVEPAEMSAALEALPVAPAPHLRPRRTGFVGSRKRSDLSIDGETAPASRSSVAGNRSTPLQRT